MVPLKTLLDRVEQTNKISFFYNKQLIDNKQLDGSLLNSGNLAEELAEILDGFGLAYQKHTARTYLILEKSEAEVAMQETVSGRITDAQTNDALPGVNILLKGTTTGTSSDVDGQFELGVPSLNDTLMISYIGYQTAELPIDGRSQIDVQLSPEAILGEEMVVVAYGEQRRANLTGSIDAIRGDALENRPASNVADLVKGAAPNLNIDMGMRGGEPGAVSSWNIRGMGSLSGNSAPLILVDGVEMNINNIDPETIESISILKDASASAIYGSRAPFGVVLITTKQGHAGEGVRISYSNNFSINAPMKVPSFIDSYTWATAYNQAAANAGAAAVYGEEQMQRIQGYLNGTFEHEYDPNNPIDNIWAGRREGNANYDWPQVLVKDYSSSQKHNINVSGGNEHTQYYISGGFSDQEGMYEYGYDSYDRYNFLSNLTTEITDWFTFNSSLKYARGRTDYPVGQTTVGREHWFREIIMFAPMMPFYNINGTIQSPLVRLMQDTGRIKTETNDFFITLGSEIEPLDGWLIDFSYNYNNINTQQAVNPRPVLVELGTGEYGNIGKPSSGYQSTFTRNTFSLLNLVTTYQQDFGSHHFSILGGYEQEENLYANLAGTAENLITDEVPSISTALGATTLNDRQYHWATQGVFGRFNYNFDEKYLLEVSARYNGSSRFAEGSRWGLFPSASVGYNISQEDFWNPISPYVNMFKLRASYGSLGNQNVANYLYLPTIPVSSELSWIIDNERPPFSNAPGLISDQLTWETITTFNLGLDAEFLDHRLSLTFDWFDRVSSDMLGPSETLPYVLGASTPRSNNAELSTRGFEIALTWSDYLSNTFAYNVGLSIGDNKTTITRYRNEEGLIGTWYEGKEVGEIWGLTSDGLIQSADEPMPDQSRYHANWGPGDMKYKDLNGDDVVDDGMRTLDDHGDLSIIGNTSPRYNIGITAGFNWRAFDFNMFWQGIGKRDYYPHLNSTNFWGMITAATNSGLYKNSPALDYWRPADDESILGPNTDAYFAKPYFTSETNKNRQIQTRYLLDASYLRLKNLQIGYTLPQNLLDSLFLSSARIYLSGENLLTFTALPDTYDPETVIASDPSHGGYLTAGVIYPTSRSFSIGLNVTF